MLGSLKVDCFTILFKNKIEADHFQAYNSTYAYFFSFKNCAPIVHNDCTFEVLCKISFDDIIKTIYPDKVFNNFLHLINFLFQILTLNDSCLLNHFEIAFDLNFDFEEHFPLFQSLILYYKKKVNGQKSVLMTDLSKSIKSGLSVKRKNVQLVIYNKQFELLKNNYHFNLDPITRIEFRFFNLNESFTLHSILSRYTYFVHFFSSYNHNVFKAIENDLSENLFNNFQKEKTLYSSEVALNKKFSIKNFLISQKDFCISKRTIKLFYEKLKDEKIVIGDFDDYYNKVISTFRFNFIESKNLELFFQKVCTSSTYFDI
jgi:hypothetical protein